MQSDRVLLTIAVPTYNRSQCLHQLLERLLPQTASQPGIEVIVSDNASADNTCEVVRHFIEDGARVRYIRNPANIGADANFLQCYNLAQGEYLWIVGDDDIILNGSVARILDILTEQRFDLIYIPSHRFRGDDPPPDLTWVNRRAKPFRNATHFGLRVGTGLAFISGNIVRKKKIEALPHPDFSAYANSGLIQLAWTLTLLESEAACLLLQDKLVANRTENTGGYGTYKVFASNMNCLVRQVLGDDSPLGRAFLNRNLQSFLPWATVEDRSGRSVRNLPEDHDAILPEIYGGNFRYWVFLWPILKLPLSLARVWLFAVRVTNRVDQLLDFPLTRGM
ncbi:MAG: glycosyltransferase family 2 protein [Acidobacteriaceae bacterium]